MNLARAHGVPVVLQGQGGDELFWGYPQMRLAAAENFKKARLLKNPFPEALIQTLNFGAPRGFSANALSNWLRDLGGARSALRNVRKHLATRDRLVSFDKSDDFLFAAAVVPALYTSKFAARISETDAFSLFDFAGDWKSADVALTALVCATYLRENGIAQGDRLGMASSIEMRLPLVDHQFVETIIGLRKARTDARLPPKHWLKEAARGVVPDWVLNRPKRGFAPPTREWHDALFKAYGNSLIDGFLVEAEILKPESGRLLSKGEFPPEAVCPLSFKALVLEQWCRAISDL
jgi:asparagine synthase (glutamine-hydrolysing)